MLDPSTFRPRAPVFGAQRTLQASAPAREANASERIEGTSQGRAPHHVAALRGTDPVAMSAAFTCTVHPRTRATMARRTTLRVERVTTTLASSRAQKTPWRPPPATLTTVPRDARRTVDLTPLLRSTTAEGLTAAHNLRNGVRRPSDLLPRCPPFRQVHAHVRRRALHPAPHVGAIAYLCP